ncbi:hypothetical protein CLV70_10329 [Pseudosporangium ferrugineum]|uniref:Uncharacterized protein n=1 Tax=Pseudosporangium ferrugineum TaxID=439699 RepID=A0A2T0SCJ2_9ACTN|nr:hypothetical protein CLV70_10329 [Pseudosporangium ferrugineum]
MLDKPRTEPRGGFTPVTGDRFRTTDSRKVPA